MISAELNNLFSDFCESFALNSFSFYVKKLMLEKNDFAAFSALEEMYQQYFSKSEINRLDLLKNIMALGISWRAFVFEDFLYSTTTGKPSGLGHAIAYQGAALFSDGKLKFQLSEIEIYQTAEGLKLNTDSFSPEISLL